jgi:hypothetical protein
MVRSKGGLRTILSVDFQPPIDVSERIIAQQFKRLRDIWGHLLMRRHAIVHLLSILREHISEVRYQYSSSVGANRLSGGVWKKPWYPHSLPEHYQAVCMIVGIVQRTSRAEDKVSTYTISRPLKLRLGARPSLFGGNCCWLMVPNNGRGTAL